MRGRTLVIGFLVSRAVFAAGLVWTQFFAYYQRQDGVAFTIAGATVPVADYTGIDLDLVAAQAPRLLQHRPGRRRRPRPGATDATLLTAPFWFSLLLRRPP